MQGFKIIIGADGSRDEEAMSRKPSLQELQAAVGGYIESVPHLDSFEHNGQRRPCFAFCNEEGKNLDLPVNIKATLLWQATVDPMKLRDHLRGPIVILTGDAAFMRSLAE